MASRVYELRSRRRPPARGVFSLRKENDGRGRIGFWGSESTSQEQARALLFPSKINAVVLTRGMAVEDASDFPSVIKKDKLGQKRTGSYRGPKTRPGVTLFIITWSGRGSRGGKLTPPPNNHVGYTVLIKFPLSSL